MALAFRGTVLATLALSAVGQGCQCDTCDYGEDYECARCDFWACIAGDDGGAPSTRSTTAAASGEGNGSGKTAAAQKPCKGGSVKDPSSCRTTTITSSSSSSFSSSSTTTTTTAATAAATVTQPPPTSSSTTTGHLRTTPPDYYEANCGGIEGCSSCGYGVPWYCYGFYYRPHAAAYGGETSGNCEERMMCYAYRGENGYDLFVPGRPLVADDGACVLPPVSWEPVALADLLTLGAGSAATAGASTPAVANPSASWVPFLGDHLERLRADAAADATAGADGAKDAALLALGGLGAASSALSVQRWVEQGRGEHASVASFNRFSLSLMGLGAPAQLVRWAQTAALEETKHAELSFSAAAVLNATTADALASADVVRGNVWVPVPGPIPIPTPLTLEDSPEDLLRSVFQEGCVAELKAAADAAVELQRLNAWFAATQCQTTRAVAFATACGLVEVARDVVAAVAEEEAGHAALAWKTVQWLLTRSSSDGAAAGGMHRALQEEMQTYLAGVQGPMEAAVAVTVVSDLYRRLTGTQLVAPDHVTAAFDRVVAATAASPTDDAHAVLAGVEALRMQALALWGN